MAAKRTPEFRITTQSGSVRAVRRPLLFVSLVVAAALVLT